MYFWRSVSGARSDDGRDAANGWSSPLPGCVYLGGSLCIQAKPRAGASPGKHLESSLTHTGLAGTIHYTLSHTQTQTPANIGTISTRLTCIEENLISNYLYITYLSRYLA